MELKKDFNCGQKVFMLVNNEPLSVKVRAINIFERLNERNEIYYIFEYFVEGIDSKVEPDKLYLTREQLIASFNPKKEDLKKGDNK